MEKVGHTVHKHHSWLLPPNGKIYEVMVERNVEIISIPGITHPLEAMGKALCVAVFATVRYSCAASRRIPSGVSPFDGRFSSHI